MSGLAVVVPAAPGSPWLEPCLASLVGEEPDAIYVVSEEPPPAGLPLSPQHVPGRGGFAARANAALAAARGDGHARSLLLNDDTEVRPGALAALAGPEPLLGAVLEHWDGGVQQAGLRVSRRSARVRAIEEEPHGKQQVDALGGAALALDLDLWSELGGFDERYAFYFEDVDFCLRAAAAGVAAWITPDARVRHRGGGTRSHRHPDAAYHLGRSHTLLARELGGSLRYGVVAGAGLAWTARSVGLGGVPTFLRGLRDGLRIR